MTSFEKKAVLCADMIIMLSAVSIIVLSVLILVNFIHQAELLPGVFLFGTLMCFAMGARGLIRKKKVIGNLYLFIACGWLIVAILSVTGLWR